MKNQATTSFLSAKALKSPTPIWAKWMFRGTFLVVTAAIFVIAGDPAIPDSEKVRINVYLQGLNMVVFGFSKMFGIEIKKDEN